MRLTSPLRTAWEIARARPEADAIGWLDALARRRRLTGSALVGWIVYSVTREDLRDLTRVLADLARMIRDHGRVL